MMMVQRLCRRTETKRMSETYADRYGIYGVMAQFETPEQVLDAANRAYAAGYREKAKNP